MPMENLDFFGAYHWHGTKTDEIYLNSWKKIDFPVSRKNTYRKILDSVTSAKLQQKNQLRLSTNPEQKSFFSEILLVYNTSNWQRRIGTKITFQKFSDKNLPRNIDILTKSYIKSGSFWLKLYKSQVCWRGTCHKNTSNWWTFLEQKQKLDYQDSSP